MDKTFLRGDKVALAMVLLVVIISFTSAIPGVPHQFYGSVTGSNGMSAPDRLIITAEIEGQQVSATTTNNGNYGLGDIFYIQDPDGNRAGKTIEFFIEGEKVAEYAFENGRSTELNLISSTAYTTTSTNTGSSGGGSGGGGGGSSGGGFIITSSDEENDTATTITDETNNCEENWTCSEWLDCVNTVQKRVCTDKNNCGTEENKPAEQRECLQEDLQPGIVSRATGAAVAVKNVAIENKGISIIVLLLLIIIGLGVYRRFNSKKTKTSSVSNTSE